MALLTLARLAEPWKPILFVRLSLSILEMQIVLLHLLIAPAAFSFGEAVNAVSVWASGEELAIVANNDRKATLMPLVSDL